MRQNLSSAIIAWKPPMYFQDTMLKGAFHSMVHDHYFVQLPARDGEEPLTEMRDVFRFTAPLGVLGRVAEVMLLRRYMRDLLRERNQAIRDVAASSEWRRYVPE